MKLSSCGKRIFIKAHTIKQVISFRIKANLRKGWVELFDETDSQGPQVLNNLKKSGIDDLVEFNSSKDVTNMFEMLDGPMTKQKGYFNPTSVISWWFRS